MPDNPSSQPSDAPVLNYYAPPTRRGFGLTARHTRGLVYIFATLLLGSLVPAAVWWESLGPRYPTVVAHKAVGFTDGRIAGAVAEKISDGKYSSEVFSRLFVYLECYGMTMLDGETPSGRSEQAVLDALQVLEVRKDTYREETWTKLSTGWLAVSPASIRFWPNQGVWHTEIWWQSDRGPQPPPMSLQEGRIQVFYELPAGMQAEVMTNGFQMGPIGRAQWQADLSLRIGIALTLLLGMLVSLWAFQTRLAGVSGRLLVCALLWCMLIGALFYHAGVSIVHLGDVFRLWYTPPNSAGFHIFGQLLAPAIAGLLLCASLWLHRFKSSSR